MCHSPWALSCFGIYGESWQVVPSPCCPREFPDVISEDLSLDAGSRATAVPPSALTCFFPGVIGLPLAKIGSASRFCPANHDFSQARIFEAADISSCSGLQVCSPPRSSLPLRILPQGSRGFYVRAYRVSLPPHAPDMLTVRIQVIDGTGTFTLPDSQPCRLLTLLHGHYSASVLIRGSPPLHRRISTFGLAGPPLVPFPFAPPIRFSSSVPKPRLESCHLYPGHHMASK